MSQSQRKPLCNTHPGVDNETIVLRCRLSDANANEVGADVVASVWRMSEEVELSARPAFPVPLAFQRSCDLSKHTDHSSYTHATTVV